MDDEDIERDQLLFELISEAYKSENSRFNSIDDKASKLIIFVGILTGLLSSFGSLLLKDVPKTRFLYTFSLILLIISLLFLISSIIFGLLAYKTRRFKAVPNPSTMIKWGQENKKKIDILRIISKERSNAIKDNEEPMKEKVKDIKISYGLLIMGIIFTLIFITLLLSSEFIYYP